MTPAAFRALVPAGVSNLRSNTFLSTKIAAGETVAPPFLLVEWSADEKLWRIYGHEGRSRSDLAPTDEPMPVSIIPRGLRAGYITPEMVAADYIPEQSFGQTPVL